MNFSDDHPAELREFFFETADDLLQQLNEAGLQLEHHPGDGEIIRNVRRLVHTLKGDSAACGFRELSGLAHELEDALNPSSAAATHEQIVNVIFAAADAFRGMLRAYRDNLAPNSCEELREQIRHLLDSGPQSSAVFHKSKDAVQAVNWNAAELIQIRQALDAGGRVYNVSFGLEPQITMPSAAFQMAHGILRSLGAILAIHPPDVSSAQHISRIDAALLTNRTRELLLEKCKIPAVIASVSVDELDQVQEGPQTAPQSASFKSHSENEPGNRKETGHDSALNRASRNEAPASTHAPARTLRVDAERIDTVMNLVGELIIGKSMLHRIMLEFEKRHGGDPLRSRFADALAIHSRVLQELQHSVMKIRMVPIEQLFRRFPRVIRDVAKSCGRDVTVEISGEATDLDKSILDALAEPLAHLVRNAVTHGIESPDERQQLGKPARGTICLNAYHQASQMIIEVSDDGRGIDTAKVIRRALESGKISAVDAEKLSERDAIHLIFQPGLSTADEITENSGRGVGMDVVATALERLKGSVEVHSSREAGAKFTLSLPLTLASIQALLFRIDGRLFAAPLSSVVEVGRATRGGVHRVDNRPVMRFREQLLPVVSLHHLQPHTLSAGKVFVVVIAAGEHKFALLVDSIFGEEELVVKSLDENLAGADLVSSASILGDGTVVLILNLAAVANQVGRTPLEAIA